MDEWNDGMVVITAGCRNGDPEGTYVIFALHKITAVALLSCETTFQKLFLPLFHYRDFVFDTI